MCRRGTQLTISPTGSTALSNRETHQAIRRKVQAAIKLKVQLHAKTGLVPFRVNVTEPSLGPRLSDEASHQRTAASCNVKRPEGTFWWM